MGRPSAVSAVVSAAVLVAGSCLVGPEAGRPGSGSPPREPKEVLVVGMIDSGVNDHLDAFSCFTIVQDGRQGDAYGHGTPVASVILGVPDDPCPDWAPSVVLRSYPVITAQGTASLESLAAAVDTAVGDGVRVLNISASVGTDDPALRAAVDNAVAADVLVIAAAGNTRLLGSAYPARYPGVRSVGSSDAEGRLSAESAAGHVDHVEPGEDLPVLDAAGTYTRRSGTSLAAAATTHRILELLVADPDRADVESALTP